MTARSPSTETVQLIARIVGARRTPVAELPELIATLDRALRGLGGEPAAGRTPIETRRSEPAPRAIAAEPIRPQPAEKPRRGRPRRIPAAIMVRPEPAAAPEPPQPKLLRRATMLAQELEHHHSEPHVVARTPNGTLRGVVKWFDGRAGKGALRLTGISGDVTLDPAVLARCGIKRLYKDQEIEATVQDGGGRVQLVSLSLPGRNATPVTPALGGAVVGVVRRQPRAVMVEIKRDGLRQRAARAEAEQVLGGRSEIKITRRFTP